MKLIKLNEECTLIDIEKEQEKKIEVAKRQLTPIIDAAEEVAKATAEGEEIIDPIIGQVEQQEAQFELKESTNSEGRDLNEEISEETASAAGMGSVISGLIKDEWEAIDGYHSALITAEDLGVDETLIKIFKDIIEEEMIHVGQLEKALQLVNSTAEVIENGRDEAEEQIQDEVAEGETKAEEKLELEEPIE